MNNIYIHNKTGNKYQLVQERILIKDIKQSINSVGNVFLKPQEPLEWRGKEDSDEHLVLYKALYDNTDGPFFIRHSKDFYENFTKYEEPKPKEKDIKDCTAEQIYYFEDCSPSFEQWVQAGIELGYGECEDDFDYFDYQFHRGDLDYTR